MRWPWWRPSSVAWTVATNGRQGLAQGVACPRPEPVVRVHDVGLPREEAGAELATWWLPEMTCASGLSFGTQGGRRRAQHPDALDLGVVGRVWVGLVSTTTSSPAGHRGGQAVHVRSESADDERWVLPADHGDAHERPTLPGRRAMLPGWFGLPTSRLRWRGSATANIARLMTCSARTAPMAGGS